MHVTMHHQLTAPRVNLKKKIIYMLTLLLKGVQTK
jgi:hypothetical protein